MRHDPLAEDRDRALAVAVEVDEAAPLGARPRRGVHAHAELLEPLLGAAAELVLGQRGEELGLAGELGELHGGDGAAAADLLPPLGRVHDLAGRRHVRHARELDPLDVADDGDTGAAGIPGLCPQRRGGELAHPGVEVLLRAEAEPLRPPRRRTRTRAGRRPRATRRSPPARGRRRSARVRARAMSSTVRGVPLATLNAPGTGSGAVSASTLARATSRTCTKSRRWPPSSNTRGAVAGGQRRAEDARDAGVGRVARHPRAVDVVVAQRGDRRAGLARERGAQVLLRHLRRGVDVARVRRRVLGHRARARAARRRPGTAARSGRRRGRARPAAAAATTPCSGQA